MRSTSRSTQAYREGSNCSDTPWACASSADDSWPRLDSHHRLEPCEYRSAGFQTCCVADFQVGSAVEFGRPADLEIRDTADLEVCATLVYLMLFRRLIRCRKRQSNCWMSWPFVKTSRTNT